jgi:hypothetical protein
LSRISGIDLLGDNDVAVSVDVPLLAKYRIDGKADSINERWWWDQHKDLRKKAEQIGSGDSRTM